jgi:hypothetical protein
MQKVYPNDNNIIAVICPKCKKTKEIDATPFLKKQGLVNLTFRFKCEFCDCGHKDCQECKEGSCTNSNTNIITIERRKFFRKKVDLPGFLVSADGKRHSIRVLDLSRTGVGTKVQIPHTLQVDQILQLEFTLDDGKETLIKKQLVVRKINDKVVDGEFTETENYDKNDKEIGFYLMK